MPLHPAWTDLAGRLFLTVMAAALIGFIGAGAILRRGSMITGVTTAATWWSAGRRLPESRAWSGG